MTQKTTNPDHYEDCPVNTGDGPSWAPQACRCAAITAEAEAWETEPRNMAALEEGSATTPRW
ncbi:hypothetical protein [Streptomyces sp. NPDC055036]